MTMKNMRDFDENDEYQLLCTSIMLSQMNLFLTPFLRSSSLKHNKDRAHCYKQNTSYSVTDYHIN